MKKLLPLLLFIVMAMPFPGIAGEFSNDNVSKKFPLDSEYFAYEVAQELGKKYDAAKTNLILIPAKNDRLIDNLNTFLVRNGFTLNNNSDGIVISYTFDFIDKKRAYLRLEMSDGNHVGVVRTLGEASPFLAPAAVAEEITEQQQPAISPNRAAESALTEFRSQQQPLLNTVPIAEALSPKVWILKQGSLMNQLDEWAKGENWKIIWQANYDLDLNADASFAGDFVGVVEQIFNSLPKKDNGLRVNIYKQNRVVEVIGE